MLNATDGGIHDWIKSFMIGLTSLVLFDFIVCRFILKFKRGTGGGTRWFTVHVFCNTLIVYYGYHDLIMMFTDPVKTIQTDEISSINPIAFNVALHFYHVVAYYSDLVFIDWLHHGVMFIITVPLLMSQNPTPIINANHCFITGIPGGIDYLMLVLVKKNIINASTEKLINKHLNTWMRGPGIMWVVATGYIYGAYQLEYFSYRYSNFKFNCLMIILLTNYWNAQYFAERVIGSYYRMITLNNLKNKIKQKD